MSIETEILQNPDILCNREIKFDVFLKIAESLKADYVATGHYCRVTKQKFNNETIFSLKSGKDSNKDQSYFFVSVKSNTVIKGNVSNRRSK